MLFTMKFVKVMKFFYKFTFVPSNDELDAKYLMDDPWGGVKGQSLVKGVA